ncbi:MAG: precorrin-8X methylmutase [Cyanobacteria bacterium P01_F01_bin.53]
MPPYIEHAITRASFEQIDLEIGPHSLTDEEYAIVRRVIHTTADFEFKQLVRFSGRPFAAAHQALQKGSPIVTDVSMVAAGIGGVIAKTWQVPVAVAVKQAQALSSSTEPLTGTEALPRETRSSQGIRQCGRLSPESIFAIGNAPTALLALCEGIVQGNWHPALVIGAPVGFINVVESKQALAALEVPYILIEGRKGGSAVAAAILNALMIRCWEQSSSP